MWWWPGNGPRPTRYEYTIGADSPTDAGGKTYQVICGLSKTGTPAVRIYGAMRDDKSPAAGAAVWWPPVLGNVGGTVSAGSNDNVANVTLSWDEVSVATKYRYRAQKSGEAADS